MPGSPPVPDLIDRRSQLTAAEEVLRGARRGDGAVLAVVGEAGLGKTALLAAIARRAEQVGFRVLRVRGAELEQGLAFGLVRRLLGRDVPVQLVRAAPAPAAELLDPATVPEGEADDPFRALHALYWVCTSLAEQAPLCVVIDDAQWSDEASLRFLAYLRERLDGVPLVLAAGLRPAAPEAATALAQDPRTVELRLSPLPLDRAAELVRLHAARLPEAQARAAAEATGGVPFLLVALARHLARSSEVPQVEAVAAMAPDAVVRAILARLRAAGPDAGAVAQAAAVLGEDAELRHVAALAGLPAARAALAADALVAADVLTDARPLEFVHAIVRSAVLAELPTGRRSLLHRAAADALRAGGAPALRVALQLLPTEPAGDPATVATLRAGVAEAGGPGGHETAVALLRRALAEPPPPGELAGVLAALGVAERHRGLRDAREHLEAALSLVSDPTERLGLVLELAAVDELEGNLPEAIGALEGALETLDATGAPDELVASIAANALGGRLLALQPVAPPAVADLAARRDRLPAGSPERTMLTAVLSYLLWFRGAGSRGDVVALCREVLEGGLPEALLERPAGLGVLPTATGAGLQELVLEALDVGAVARSTGSIWAASAIGTWRALAGLVAGRTAEAEAEVQSAFDGFGMSGILAGRVASGAVLALVLLEREGPRAAQEILDQLTEVPPVVQGMLVHRAAARVALAAGNHAAARRHAGLLRDGVLPAGLEEPLLMGWRGELALALHAEGAPGAGGLAAEHLARCEASGSAWFVAEALAVQARVGAPEAAGPLLERAVALAEPAGAPLVAASALAALGGHLRRAGRPAEAREPLERAVALAERSGARWRRDRYAEELAAAGGSAARRGDEARDALTPSEQRAARMAAEGLTNREIAQALFVTTKTVETHLRAAFRKLDVGRRTELARALERAA